MEKEDGHSCPGIVRISSPLVRSSRSALATCKDVLRGANPQRGSKGGNQVFRKMRRRRGVAEPRARLVGEKQESVPQRHDFEHSFPEFWIARWTIEDQGLHAAGLHHIFAAEDVTRVD